MKQITIQGFAYCKPAEAYNTGYSNCLNHFVYDFSPNDASDWGDGYIHVGTATLTIDAPENFDPRMGAVEALEKKRKQIQAEFQARITEIDRQISQYTAIEYVEEA